MKTESQQRNSRVKFYPGTYEPNTHYRAFQPIAARYIFLSSAQKNTLQDKLYDQP
jgi:hypothetical protein